MTKAETQQHVHLAWHNEVCNYYPTLWL